jgi:tetratricopeptide (TPR) repeat protein
VNDPNPTSQPQQPRAGAPVSDPARPSPDPATPSEARTSRPQRLWLFRSGAILAGILPFILLETALRLLDLGRQANASDPLSGFNRNFPLFERQDSLYRTAPSREPFFPAQQFPAAKPPNAFRIFCLGGSTVHGHPYQSETAFPKWLELELAGSYPNQSFQAVNCGGVSYASYRLAPIVKEVLNYHPDLVIVATGENEFLEDRTYHSLKSRSALRAWFDDAAYSLRIANVLRNWIRRGQPTPGATPSGANGNTQLSPEVRPRLDDRSGYASYHRDDPWHDRVAAHFEESLRAMVEMCHRARVPIMLVKLGSNLRDCPPFKSEHRPGLPADTERAWQAAFDAATAAEHNAGARPSPGAATTETRTGSDFTGVSRSSRTAAHGDGRAPPAVTDPLPPPTPSALTSALALYRKAEPLDADYALLSYRIARVLDRLGRNDEALQYYLKARDQDICPLRAPKRHEEILNAIAAETKTPLVDAANLLAARSSDAIPGNDWYLDHVHPTIGGHQKIAQAIAARIREAGLLPSVAPWPDDSRRETYRRQLDQLAPNYLADGRRRVEWLENWSRRQRLFDDTLPNDAPGYLRLGSRRLDCGDEDGAWAAFTEALKLDPNVIQSLRNHAQELSSQGRPESAQKLLNRAALQ